jgi:ribosomal protein S18
MRPCAERQNSSIQKQVLRKSFYKMMLGLTGQEPVVEVKKKTTCSLCSRFIHQGDLGVALPTAGGGWMIHQDCAIAQITKEHSLWITKIERNTTRRTRVQKKKERVSQGDEVCRFCHRLIDPGDVFVTEHGKAFHTKGTNSCVVRFRRVVNATKRSLVC